MSIEVQISKWGKSLAIRIPSEIFKRARLAEGDRFSFDVNSGGRILLGSAKRKYDLDDLVSRITPQNRHKETDWG
jgi:antitoxin MazE